MHFNSHNNSKVACRNQTFVFVKFVKYCDLGCTQGEGEGRGMQVSFEKLVNKNAIKVKQKKITISSVEYTIQTVHIRRYYYFLL